MWTQYKDIIQLIVASFCLVFGIGQIVYNVLDIQYLGYVLLIIAFLIIIFGDYHE
jgi:hypothetical protein